MKGGKGIPIDGDHKIEYIQQYIDTLQVNADTCIALHEQPNCRLLQYTLGLYYYSYIQQ